MRLPLLAAQVTARPVARLVATTPHGISVWTYMLYKRFVCCRPLHRVAVWRADMGLAVSPGTLADSIGRFVPLVEPLAEALLAHRKEAALRHPPGAGRQPRLHRKSSNPVYGPGRRGDRAR